MSSALSALSQSINKNRPRTLMGRSHMVVEVLSYGDKTIKAKVLSGQIAGQEIELNPGNKKVEDFSKPSKAQTSSYTPVGGILRCENVSLEKDGTYLSAWTNAWIKTPNDANQILVDQAASYVNKGKTNKDEKPVIHVQTVDAKNEVKATSLEEFEAQLVKAFETTRAALVVDTSEGFGATSYKLNGGFVDGKFAYEDPKEFAAKLISDLSPEVKALFKGILETNGLVVVPTRFINVGPTTAEEVQKALDKASETGKRARIMSVNPHAYEAPSIGIRLTGALTRKDRDGKLDIATEYSDRLKDAFLATAPESAKAAFHADGWKGVSDVDLKDFFASKGVVLKDHPTQTWNTASVHMQKFEGGDNFFAAKTFEQHRYGSPYPVLEVCKDLRRAYANELSEAVKLVMAAPVVKADATAKADASVSDAKVADPKSVEEQKIDDAKAAEAADNIDDLLNQLAGDSMDMGD